MRIMMRNSIISSDSQTSLPRGVRTDARRFPALANVRDDLRQTEMHVYPFLFSSLCFVVVVC